MNTPKISALIMIYTFLVILLSLTGCEGKQVCSYCGEEKYCKEYTIIDKTRFICDDCLNSELNPTSANVIFDYTSELLDPSVYGIISEDSVSEEFQDTPESEEESDNSPTLEEIMNTPHIAEENIDSESSDTTTDNSIINKVSDKLISLGYTLEANENNENSFCLYKDNSNIQIVFDFTNITTSKPGLTISLNNSDNENDFVRVSIASSLAFLDSNDYEGLGYSIYNNASQYGNYSYNNHGFYYLPGSPDSQSDSQAILTFQITTK